MVKNRFAGGVKYMPFKISSNVDIFYVKFKLEKCYLDVCNGLHSFVVLLLNVYWLEVTTNWNLTRLDGRQLTRSQK